MNNIHSQYTKKKSEVALHVSLQEFKLVCYAFCQRKRYENCDLEAYLVLPADYQVRAKVKVIDFNLSLSSICWVYRWIE